MAELRPVPIPAFLSDEPEWSGDLDEAIFAGAALPEVAERWRPQTRGQAEWAMRKLAALTEREADINAQSADWRARIIEWATGELRRLDPGIRYFTSLLEQYALDARVENPKEATVRLPSGEIGTTVPKTPRVKVDDEAAVIAWATEHLDDEAYGLVVKESVRVSELAKLADVQRRLVPFCTICGVAVVATEPDGPSWHDGEVDACLPYDHEAVPGPMWEVLIDGETVPGTSAMLGDPSASVRPAR